MKKIDWRRDNSATLIVALIVGLAYCAPRILDSLSGFGGDGIVVTSVQAKPNLILASTANRGIVDKSGPTQKGLCQKWVRLRVQNINAYGPGAYQRYMKGTARLTGLAFLKHSPYGHPRTWLHTNGGLQPGDILYKTDPNNSGGVGHVGICVGRVPAYKRLGVMIAENSSTSIRRIRGAKGWRTLKEFGTYDVVVRLPMLEKEIVAPSK